tara:strand:+ start:521 stop:700 length:180 start_codon:yes stop_codon:yes gene_type:complete
MAKYRIKIETNSVTKKVRYCVQERDWFLLLSMWVNHYITYDKEDAQYYLDILIKQDSWK